MYMSETLLGAIVTKRTTSYVRYAGCVFVKDERE